MKLVHLLLISVLLISCIQDVENGFSPQEAAVVLSDTKEPENDLIGDRKDTGSVKAGKFLRSELPDGYKNAILETLEPRKNGPVAQNLKNGAANPRKAIGSIGLPEATVKKISTHKVPPALNEPGTIRQIETTHSNILRNVRSVFTGVDGRQLVRIRDTSLDLISKANTYVNKTKTDDEHGLWFAQPVSVPSGSSRFFVMQRTKKVLASGTVSDKGDQRVESIVFTSSGTEQWKIDGPVVSLSKNGDEAIIVDNEKLVYSYQRKGSPDLATVAGHVSVETGSTCLLQERILVVDGERSNIEVYDKSVALKGRDNVNGFCSIHACLAEYNRAYVVCDNPQTREAELFVYGDTEEPLFRTWYPSIGDPLASFDHVSKSLLLGVRRGEFVLLDVERDSIKGRLLVPGALSGEMFQKEGTSNRGLIVVNAFHSSDYFAFVVGARDMNRTGALEKRDATGKLDIFVAVLDYGGKIIYVENMKDEFGTDWTPDQMGLWGSSTDLFFPSLESDGWPVKVRFGE